MIAMIAVILLKNRGNGVKYPGYQHICLIHIIF